MEFLEILQASSGSIQDIHIHDHNKVNFGKVLLIMRLLNPFSYKITLPDAWSLPCAVTVSDEARVRLS